MILPITTYGNSSLRKKTEEIDSNYEGLKALIDNMFETMYGADGIGLAAPQVDKSIQLFIIDLSPLADEKPELANFKQVFINPIIRSEEGEEKFYNEGCLSVPGVHEDVKRKTEIVIEYYDENFQLIEEKYDGVKARVIQHEYDHLDGILFTDKVGGIRKRLIKGKLAAISKGKTNTTYKIRTPQGIKK